jgi:rhodanese-related sulfurtransferase
MGVDNMKVKKIYVTALCLQLLFSVAYGLQANADDVVPQTAGHDSAKICLSCHKAESNTLMGVWENVAMKSLSIQLSIDDRSEIITFDKAKLQLLNTAENGDVEKMLRSIKKGDEVRIRFIEQDGIRQATLIKVKPALKVAAGEKITVAELEKLVAKGPEKGKYKLFDSRPLFSFRKGTIPTSVSLSFSELAVKADLLPKDTKRLIVFYGDNARSRMGIDSMKRAKALGYRNVKVLAEGMDGWLERNSGMISAAALTDDTYHDVPYVLIDARPVDKVADGFIRGAAAFAATDKKALNTLPKKELKAPIIVYDEEGRGNAAKTAVEIVKSGQVNVMVLEGGIAAAKLAKLPMESGKPGGAISYAPKPKPGEFSTEQFIKIIEAIPADTLIIDVRNSEELKEGSISGAVNIPAQEAFRRAAEIPKDKKVIAYCNTGARAEMAYHILKAKGFTNVFFLKAHVDFDNGKPDIYN